MLEDDYGQSSPPKIERWPHDGIPWIRQPFVAAPGLDSLLTWSVRVGASSVRLLPGQPVLLTSGQGNHKVTRAAVSHADAQAIQTHTFGRDAADAGQSAVIYPVARDGGAPPLRFRVCANPVQTSEGPGQTLLFRPLQDLPPSLGELAVQPAVVAATVLRRGLVVVCGVPGSGRSTLMASMAAAKLRDPFGHYSIAFAAENLEFLLDRIPSGSSTIAHSDVPRQFPDYARFIESATRRGYSDIVVDGDGDASTTLAAVFAARSGVNVTAGLAAHSVRHAVELLVGQWRHDDETLSNLMQSLSLIVAQRLVPAMAGGLTPLREYLVMRPELRESFRNHPSTWPKRAHEALDTNGQSFAVAVRQALLQSLISEQTAVSVMENYS